MIFYFSATGNSKYAAERIAAATDDRLVFLRDAIRSRSYQYDVSHETRIGFVVPTYFQGLPSILTFFLNKLRLTGYADQYAYVVLTCGESTGDAAGQMAKMLRSKGVTLSAQFGIPMVDNYIPMFKIAEDGVIAEQLDGPSAHWESAITTAVRAGCRRCGPPRPTRSTPMAGLLNRSLLPTSVLNAGCVRRSVPAARFPSLAAGRRGRSPGAYSAWAVCTAVLLRLSAGSRRMRTGAATTTPVWSLKRASAICGSVERRTRRQEKTAGGATVFVVSGGKFGKK